MASNGGMKSVRELRVLRGYVVAALNLTPLVPPQADDETLRVVDEAWAALSTIMAHAEQAAR